MERENGGAAPLRAVLRDGVMVEEGESKRSGKCSVQVGCSQGCDFMRAKEMQTYAGVNLRRW